MDKLDIADELIRRGVDEKTAERFKGEVNGNDLMNLVQAFNRTDRPYQSQVDAEKILGKYGIKLGRAKMNDDYLNAKFESLRSGLPLDETFGFMTKLNEGFSYSIEVSEQNRDRVLDWLDENQVEYQATSPVAYRIECGDRDMAYRTGRALSEIIRKPTVRDSRHCVNESYVVEVETNAAEFSNQVSKIMKEIAGKFQNHTTDSKTVPSGPDTSKFSTSQKGMITYVSGIHIPGGMYGFDRVYQHFLKIGSAVGLKVEKEMKEEFLHRVSNLTEKGEFNEKEVLKTSDGIKIHFGTVDGSAWGGFGFWFEKPRVESIEEKMSKKPEKRAKDAKAKIDSMKARNPVVAAVKTRGGAGAHDNGKDPRKVDKFGRGAKHKARFDEEIGYEVGEEVMVGEVAGQVKIPHGPNGTIGVIMNGQLEMVAESEVSRLDEGVIGMMKPVNPLFRLRELAGLPLESNDDFSGIEVVEAPEIDPEGILAAGPVVDDLEDMEVDSMADMDGDIEDNMEEPLTLDVEIPSDDLELPADAGVPGAVGTDPIMPVGNTLPTQSEAMSQIEDALNSIQAGLADIRLSEYKSLIQKLQDLTNQAQMMGRDYLGERRKK